VIDEADAIVNYFLSLNGIYDDTVILPGEHISEFKSYLQDILEKENTITTVKDEGIFVCKRR
jgi:hypothetical protein